MWHHTPWDTTLPCVAYHTCECTPCKGQGYALATNWSSVLIVLPKWCKGDSASPEQMEFGSHVDSLWYTSSAYSQSASWLRVYPPSSLHSLLGIRLIQIYSFSFTYCFVVGKDRGTTPLLLRNWWLTPKIRQTENCPFYSQQTPFLYHQMWNVNIPLWQLESNCYREVFVLCRCHSGGGNSGSSCDTVSTFNSHRLTRLKVLDWFHISISKRDLLAYTYYCYNITCMWWLILYDLLDDIKSKHPCCNVSLIRGKSTSN